MRALKNIDVAFVCMNLPYTMTPQAAGEAVRAFRPKVAYPYHYRGSDVQVFEKALAGSGVEVRLLEVDHFLAGSVTYTLSCGPTILRRS